MAHRERFVSLILLRGVSSLDVREKAHPIKNRRRRIKCRFLFLRERERRTPLHCTPSEKRRLQEAAKIVAGKWAAMKVQKDLPQSWWFESHNNSRQSPWLVSTLSELEEKTKQMLKLIEEDADSFAQRAEMYYKKRPLLINLIGDFYRDHRSLAEQYDHLKSGGGIRHTLSGPSLLDRTWSQKVSNNTSDGSSLFSSDCYDSEESEVDDPEQEESEAETKPRDEPDKENDNDLVKLMKIELQILEEQNVTLKAELAGKDEEKREVIRQLASSIGILKEENADMRKCIKNLRKWGNIYELKKKTKELFSGKVFGGHSKSQTTVVAL